MPARPAASTKSRAARRVHGRPDAVDFQPTGRGKAAAAGDLIAQAGRAASDVIGAERPSTQ
jgi:hypothetical protein